MYINDRDFTAIHKRLFDEIERIAQDKKITTLDAQNFVSLHMLTDSGVNYPAIKKEPVKTVLGMAIHSLARLHTTNIAKEKIEALVETAKAVGHLHYMPLNTSLQERAKRAAEAKAQSDPRRKEKEFVHDCWIEWQSNPSNYKSKAAFARDMLTKCEHITSQKVIEDWCRVWEESEPC
jgi:hypothetical protein